jgi:hypothetical protein
MCLIQRECSKSLLDFVRQHAVFECMREGIATGKILPCLRKNEVHFYEGGARLFRFSAQNVYTHRQYIDGMGNGDRALSISEQNFITVEDVMKKAREHRELKVSNELAAVHRLFPGLALTRSAHKAGQLSLIDIEARFGASKSKGLPTTMIDLAFLVPDHRVLFMEAKCMGHSAIASSANAKVEAQVANYEAHIRDACVLPALARSMEVQLQLLRKTGEPPIGIFPRVPILLFDPSTPKREIGRKNTWLSNRLDDATVWTIKSERPIVIDGRDDPVKAVREFAERFCS